MRLFLLVISASHEDQHNTPFISHPIDRAAGQGTAPTVIDVNYGCCSAQTPFGAAGVSG
jgi:hypothetical protein